MSVQHAARLTYLGGYSLGFSTRNGKYSVNLLRTRDANGQDVGTVRGVLGTVLSMIERGATHIGIATDHVVESFRNDLYAGYKTSEGVPPSPFRCGRPIEP